MLQRIIFNDKNQYSHNINDRILTTENINQIKYCINAVIDYINNFSFPVSSVNGMSGIVQFDFPVSSVNEQTGNVWINFPVSSVNGMTGDVQFNFPVSSVNGQTGHVKFDFPVSSVNGQTGNIWLTLSSLYNDVGYITSDDIPVSSVNGQTGNVVLSTSHIYNDSGYITTNDIPVSSVNGKTGHVWISAPVSSVNGMTGDVWIDFPVSSVNGQTGNVLLSTSHIYNDSGYITSNDIPVSSVNVTNSLSQPTSTTGHAKVFVPNKVSQVDNDLGFYNNLYNFMRVITDINQLSEAEPGYLYCILQNE